MHFFWSFLSLSHLSISWTPHQIFDVNAFVCWKHSIRGQIAGSHNETFHSGVWTKKPIYISSVCFVCVRFFRCLFARVNCQLGFLFARSNRCARLKCSFSLYIYVCVLRKSRLPMLRQTKTTNKHNRLHGRFRNCTKHTLRSPSSQVNRQMCVVVCEAIGYRCSYCIRRRFFLSLFGSRTLWMSTKETQMQCNKGAFWCVVASSKLSSNVTQNIRLKFVPFRGAQAHCMWFPCTSSGIHCYDVFNFTRFLFEFSQKFRRIAIHLPNSNLLFDLNHWTRRHSTATPNICTKHAHTHIEPVNWRATLKWWT